MTALALHALPLARHAAAVAAACLLGVAAHAAQPAPQASANGTSASSRAEAERAACLNGTSQQDRATCLKEVGAAQEERRRGTLSDGQQGRYDDNARQRCQQLPGDQQADCLKRANGLGEQSGSVAGGGILKETVTVTVGTPQPVQQPAPAASAASAPASPASDPPAPSVR